MLKFARLLSRHPVAKVSRLGTNLNLVESILAYLISMLKIRELPFCEKSVVYFPFSLKVV